MSKYLQFTVYYAPGVKSDLESQVCAFSDEYAFVAIRDGLHGNVKGDPVVFNLSEMLNLRVEAKERSERLWKRILRKLAPWRFYRRPYLRLDARR